MTDSPILLPAGGECLRVCVCVQVRRDGVGKPLRELKIEGKAEKFCVKGFGHPDYKKPQTYFLINLLVLILFTQVLKYPLSSLPPQWR